ncbi:hypothetical protein [Methanoregula sp.]|uniref:hypothetical protein n=1 Tax=Methanoregula sp. TaxID=2052170 RepID=UPI002BAA78F4|nr:hypothetical protein [Methanoregula sp.]HVP97263.1 hypothetical protein [Methanoregula sp.]
MKTRNGWVVIDGVRYDHDVVIHTDRSVTRRHKKPSKPLKQTYGHTPLYGVELGFLIHENPVVLYIGTGQYGDLPLTPGTEKILAGYETVIRPTPELLPLMEEELRPFVAILHVNC